MREIFSLPSTLLASEEYHEGSEPADLGRSFGAKNKQQNKKTNK